MPPLVLQFRRHPVRIVRDAEPRVTNEQRILGRPGDGRLRPVTTAATSSNR
jgi:hypothetical protein